MAGEVDAIGGVEEVSSEFDLHDMTSDATQNADIETAMSEALTGALSEAMTRPHHRAEAESLGGEFTKSTGTDLTDAKSEVLSGIDREGAVPSNRKEEDAIDGIEATADAISDLMGDLTTWHMTWGFAQAAQKDATHILKSS